MQGRQSITGKRPTSTITANLSTTTRSSRAFDYFDHDADLGIVGRGATCEESMIAAAEATFAVMTDLHAVRDLQSVVIDFDEPDAELALVTWLNRLLAEARIAGLALAHFTLDHQGAHWHGTASGEPWRAELDRGVEVKGATLTMLAVHPLADGWVARCVIDV